MPGRKGRSGVPGVTRPAGPGRQPVLAELREGVIVMLSHVWPGGEHVDLGRGVVSQVRKIQGGNDRIVVIPQPDGSEIRIVIAAEE